MHVLSNPHPVIAKIQVLVLVLVLETVPEKAPVLVLVLVLVCSWQLPGFTNIVTSSRQLVSKIVITNTVANSADNLTGFRTSCKFHRLNSIPDHDWSCIGQI